MQGSSAPFGEGELSGGCPASAQPCSSLVYPVGEGAEQSEDNSRRALSEGARVHERAGNGEGCQDDEK